MSIKLGLHNESKQIEAREAKEAERVRLYGIIWFIVGSLIKQS